MADGWKRKMISCLNEIFVVLISVLIFLFEFLFCSILETKDDKSFKRDIIVFISFPILFVSTFFLVDCGKEMSLPGFRKRFFNCVSGVVFIISPIKQNFKANKFEQLSEGKIKV